MAKSNNKKKRTNGTIETDKMNSFGYTAKERIKQQTMENRNL